MLSGYYVHSRDIISLIYYKIGKFLSAHESLKKGHQVFRDEPATKSREAPSKEGSDCAGIINNFRIKEN